MLNINNLKQKLLSLFIRREKRKKLEYDTLIAIAVNNNSCVQTIRRVSLDEWKSKMLEKGGERCLKN